MSNETKQKSHAAIIAEMRADKGFPVPYAPNDDRAIWQTEFVEYANLLEAAHNREIVEIVKSIEAKMFEPVGGNVSALREAAEALCAISESDIGELRALSARLNDESVYGGGLIASIVHYIGNLRAALAMPRRNCDVGTVEEQEERYKATGETYHTLTLTNALKWAQMPCVADAEKGGEV